MIKMDPGLFSHAFQFSEAIRLFCLYGSNGFLQESVLFLLQACIQKNGGYHQFCLALPWSSPEASVDRLESLFEPMRPRLVILRNVGDKTWKDMLSWLNTLDPLTWVACVSQESFSPIRQKIKPQKLALLPCFSWTAEVKKHWLDQWCNQAMIPVPEPWKIRLAQEPSPLPWIYGLRAWHLSGQSWDMAVLDDLLSKKPLDDGLKAWFEGDLAMLQKALDSWHHNDVISHLASWIRYTLLWIQIKRSRHQGDSFDEALEHLFCGWQEKLFFHTLRCTWPLEHALFALKTLWMLDSQMKEGRVSWGSEVMQALHACAWRP